jgi:hypothetical protein
LRSDPGLARPSLDGGFKEFFEFMPSCLRNSAFSALSSAISARAADSPARTWDSSARNSPTA